MRRSKLTALRAAPAKALEVAQSIELADHFSAREIYLIDLWVDQMAQIVLKDPEYVAKLVRDGAQAIILGCTEITLLVDAQDADVPLFDTTALHATAAAERALV